MYTFVDRYGRTSRGSGLSEVRFLFLSKIKILTTIFTNDYIIFHYFLENKTSKMTDEADETDEVDKAKEEDEAHEVDEA